MTYDFFIHTFMLTYLVIIVASFIICKIKKSVSYRFAFIALFELYILIIIKLVFLPLSLFDQTHIDEFYVDFGEYIVFYQLVPFDSIKSIMEGPLWYVQIFGNILLLFPLSIFVGFMCKKSSSAWKIIMVGILTSIGIEVSQLVIDIATQYPNKVMDIDDLILNTCGIIMGAIIYKCLKNTHKLYSWVDTHVVRKKSISYENQDC